jgi:DNA-binding NarL/FixJ family response regulator
VVVIDVSLGEMSGIEATKRILARDPGTKVIGLSMFSEADVGAQILQAGAVAYLSKGGPPQDLMAAIRAACR